MQVKTVCDLYEQAPQLHAQGIHLVSADEKTGIQALERAAPTKPMQASVAGRQASANDKNTNTFAMARNA